MDKFIPYEKMSKKEKSEIDKKARGAWVANPTTRIVQSKKVYNRKTNKKNNEQDISNER